MSEPTPCPDREKQGHCWHIDYRDESQASVRHDVYVCCYCESARRDTFRIMVPPGQRPPRSQNLEAPVSEKRKLADMDPADATSILGRIQRILNDERYPERMKLWLIAKTVEPYDVEEPA